MKKIKILQIVPSLSLANGVAVYLNNYYNFMNLKLFDTTILVLNDDDKGRYEFFKQKGCKIIDFYKCESWPLYLKKINNFFANNKFDIVHCHVANYGAFFMYYAKKNNVKIRILHSHANRSADKITHAMRNSILIPFARKNSNFFIACSESAGKFMFKKNKFVILNNAIDFKKFKYNEELRKKIRHELNITDRYVIGSFGRLCPQKNQLFTIDVFKKIHNHNSNAILLLIGDGELHQKIVEKINKYNIEENVILLESKANISDYYNCLDLFLLPSTYEGLGIVLIEAQANNLPCYTSMYNVPSEAKISPLLKFIKLKGNHDEWATTIVSDNLQRKCYYKQITTSNFNIENEASKLEKIYLSF